jgi:hypothetical protein
MRVRTHRGTVLLAALLVTGLLAGTGTASGIEAVPGSIEGTVTDHGAGCLPFDNTHLVWVDAFEATTKARHYDPVDSLVTDGTGVYSVPDLPPGNYKLRVRVLGDDGQLAAYWWYTAVAPGAADFTGGDTITVSEASAAIVDPCVERFSGGWFRGKVVSETAGFRPECVALMPYEGASGISIGMSGVVKTTGFYRYETGLPAGDYRVLAYQSMDPACPVERTYLDQWWNGHSGAGFDEYVDPPLFASAGTASVGAGAWTDGIRFDLIEIGTCRGQVPTILGTTDIDDLLLGTEGDDVIRTFAGNDHVHGEGGNDIICTDQGNDDVSGGDGKDIIITGWNDDRAYGGPGRDRLILGGGDDYGYGGNQGDLLKGGSGDDHLFGGSQNDKILGQGGWDIGGGERGASDYCDTEIQLAGCELP